MTKVLIKYKQDKGEDIRLKDNSSPDTHQKKLKFCLESIPGNNKENDNKRPSDKEHIGQNFHNIKETIYNIRDLRNIVSHRGSAHLDIESRIKNYENNNRYSDR